MTKSLKGSRCAFVVIKFRIEGEDHLLMRRDPDWKDINFIGGHERPQDGRSLGRAARRELLEEVPALRTFNSFELVPLTEEISHGPIFSRSAGCQVKYVLRFFMLRFIDNPKPLFEALGPRTLNILVNESDLLIRHRSGISGLVNVLDSTLRGGLRAIPYSWPEDLGTALRGSKFSRRDQPSLPLH